jgi:transposase-like protein
MKPNGDSKPRRQFPAETKLQILKEGCTTHLTISQVCDQYQISPTLFYQWERRAEYGAYYNNQRPHSALHYLCPHDYYRGDPAALLTEREAKLQAAAEARRTLPSR